MDRERLAAQLRLHEGVEHKPYKCTAGYLTIGVGRNIEERGLSDDEIDYILNNDVDIATSELASTFDWFAGLDDVRMRVVVDMVFNLGMPRFKQFQNMLAAIEAARLAGGRRPNDGLALGETSRSASGTPP